MEIEKILDDSDLIVSSTDKRGIICYANSTFSRISEYTKKELYGKPHNIIRHPDMPKAMFKYIWSKLLEKEPVVAYVKNYIKGKESFYWVKAVMYPKIKNNEIDKITSYRTKATNFEISQISQIYRNLVDYEKNHSVDESINYFFNFLKQRELSYSQFTNRLNEGKQVLTESLVNLDISQFRADHMVLRSRIESLVEKGYKNIEVLKCDCCDFGKKLQFLEHESFSNEKQFTDIKRLHEKVHNELQSYADDNENKRGSYMDDVYKDIDMLFHDLEELSNEYITNLRT